MLDLVSTTTVMPTMATYQQLQRDPISQALFDNRITTMKDLQRTLKEHAIIALDTENIPVERARSRILHQVGLAYLPTMAECAHVPGQSCLDDFINKDQMRCLTLNINTSDQTRHYLIRHRCGIPSRRSSCFGDERQVDIGILESAIIKFIQSCGSKKLMLMGFDMSTEWTYLFRTFPKAIPYFSCWVDLRDIAQDIIGAVGFITGRVFVLQTFGYNRKDIKGSKKHGAAENVANDAVSVLAMASALLDPEHRERLRFRQKCSRIAKRAYNENKIAFGATIQSQEGALPQAIDSGLKLAQYFF